jgi:hypothetical protein
MKIISRARDLTQLSISKKNTGLVSAILFESLEDFLFNLRVLKYTALGLINLATKNLHIELQKGNVLQWTKQGTALLNDSKIFYYLSRNSNRWIQGH